MGIWRQTQHPVARLVASAECARLGSICIKRSTLLTECWNKRSAPAGSGSAASRAGPTPPRPSIAGPARRSRSATPASGHAARRGWPRPSSPTSAGVPMRPGRAIVQRRTSQPPVNRTPTNARGDGRLTHRPTLVSHARPQTRTDHGCGLRVTMKLHSGLLSVQMGCVVTPILPEGLRVTNVFGNYT